MWMECQASQVVFMLVREFLKEIKTYLSFWLHCDKKECFRLAVYINREPESRFAWTAFTCSMETPRCISPMVSLGFPAIFLAYICKLILYYFKVAKTTSTKMLSGIKFCPTASFTSVSKLKKQSLRSCCCSFVYSYYLLVPVLHAGYLCSYISSPESISSIHRRSISCSTPWMFTCILSSSTKQLWREAPARNL